MRLTNVHFYGGDASRVPWVGYDGFHVFNPFAENLFSDDEAIDGTVERSRERFLEHVLRVERALREVPMGTTIVTYHGMSARVPACYELHDSERAGSDWLRVWRKERPDRHGFFLEHGKVVVLHRPDGSKA